MSADPAPVATIGALEAHLRARRAQGRKLLVPYVTGGMDPAWADAVMAVADAGADAIEIGIPFSDPMIDGPVIQEASLRALRRGTTPDGVLATLSRMDLPVPLCVMTYYNIVFRAGLRRFARSLAGAGVAGAILPDLPLEEAEEWCAEADAAGVATVLLVAPPTPVERARAICARSRGFVYAVGVMGVTGERASLADSAGEVAGKVRAVTDRPVCIGIGVSTAAQAQAASAHADGVVVGSALVRRLLEGGGPDGAAAFVAELRAGLDGA
ncbi:MAG TPA: tryptophan synthase subunit alpha [Acidimicrobiales bacterium]|nr:tryptophan synthase subunit alpha [Acidimicrobiales bacterium]